MRALHAGHATIPSRSVAGVVTGAGLGGAGAAERATPAVGCGSRAGGFPAGAAFAAGMAIGVLQFGHGKRRPAACGGARNRALHPGHWTGIFSPVAAIFHAVYSVCRRMSTGTLPEVVFLALLFAASQGEDMTPQNARNRLAGSRSPYLLQHADNPVDWYPWGEEAFRRAREEGKPIFLSVGYSTCHWCHVMEEESFMNDEIAAILNEHFVPIKVDREEHPDVDQIYMAYTQAVTGHGGWPMSVWLTPDLHPFAAGTYFPPEQFAELLRAIARGWENDRARIEEIAANAVARLREASASSGAGSIGAAVLDSGRERFGRMFDRVHGGFGGAPKFPRPVTLLFLLREHARTGDREPLEQVAATLRAMARGGIHDHVGGGFHRYSVDARWHVPHFEKMLYDQALIAWAGVETWQATGDDFFAALARDVLDYVLRALVLEDGGIAAAEDAVVDGVEGAFYVWTRDEIERALGEDAAEFCRRYGVEEAGNVPASLDPRGDLRGKNVLYLVEGAEPMPGALHRLFEAREGRPHPARDDKVIAAWNGLAIGALARAGFALEEERYVHAARRAAQFVWDHLRAEDGLRRHWRGGPSEARAVAADYAFVIHGYLDLYQATFDDVWLERALALQRQMDERLWDEDSGGYFESEARADVLVRMKERYDGAEPAANSVAALNLLRLERLTGNRTWGERARRTLAGFAGIEPVAMPMAMAAAQFQIAPPIEILLAGDPARFLPSLRRRFLPNAVVLAPHRFATWTEALRSDEPVAYVCRDFTCDLPARTPQELAARLAR
jgi:uncharacterized protein YyaL (SSP411 family)